MHTGLRLYQAIIDRSELLDLPFPEASRACGFTPDTLAGCFGDVSRSKPHDLHEALNRRRIDKIADFLNCSGFRVLQMADVFRWADYCLIQSTPLFTQASTSPVDLNRETATYFKSVTQTNVLEPSFILEELVASTWSTSLQEAATKVGLSLDKLRAWRSGKTVPSLKDLADIRLIAKALEMGTPLVMMALGVITSKDFTINGQNVDIESELNLALDVEIW
ncbi:MULTISPECIES: helix-turn-helix domain-containing protein [Pseudomonas]|uniref:XRE family transcriptional regulator n=1 Tax=Pseudomonas TaxID=286 RepID=UPI00387AA378